MEKIFLIGLGGLNDLSVDTYSRVSAEIVMMMSRARVSHFALSLWDLSRGRVAPEEAATIFFRRLLEDSEDRPQPLENRQVTLIETGPWGHALRDGFLRLADRSEQLPIRLEVH